ncbi:MAG TPA: twin-arginine translocation signal domain-containing protein, partial [Sphingomonadales bacterium]|nr:twin-arginine translocation signal domain-containing protein [Sphingomonadales bacterium]
MLIRSRKSWELKERDATPEGLYFNRRQLIQTLGLAAGAGLLSAPVFSKRAEAAVEPVKVAKRRDD